nr:DNA methyltransferase [Treponema denticola]
MISEAFNIDCMEFLKKCKDKEFDLAIVDPPYGRVNGKFQGVQGGRFGNGRFDKYRRVECTGGTWAAKYKKKIIRWDVAPPKEYFIELFRVSKNQIIFGGNYFELPPTRCFIIWEKLTISEKFTMAMCEYVWTSFFDNSKIFKCKPQDKFRFHPTQKPVELYKWILKNYAKKGDKILDTHLGSGSSRIAAYDMGFDFVGMEVDKEYFDKQEKRFKEYCTQGSLFEFSGGEIKE